MGFPLKIKEGISKTNIPTELKKIENFQYNCLKKSGWKISSVHLEIIDIEVKIQPRNFFEISRGEIIRTKVFDLILEFQNLFQTNG